MFQIYNFLFIVLFTPFMLVASVFSKKFRSGFKNKIGFYPKTLEKTDKSRLLIHAVSVGEVMALEKTLTELMPNYDIVISSSTPTGYNLALKKFSGFAHITYFPFDYRFCVKKAIKYINPDAVLIFETEIWPNLVYILDKAKIPLVLINGRISLNSFKGYKKIKFFLTPIFKKYKAYLMQTQSDADRIVALGAPQGLVSVMGNVKFDILKKQTKDYKDEFKLNSPLFVAASTHAGEDEIALRVYQKLKKDFPALKLLIAPRHPERIRAVASIVEKTSFPYSLRTSGLGFDINDIIILDTVGELSLLYSMCDFAFIGGSFNKTGGHNPLEASIFQKPIISGPNISNFRLIYKVLTDSSCAQIVKTEEELYTQTLNLLKNPQKIDQISQNCLKVFSENRGATQNLLDFLKTLFKQ